MHPQVASHGSAHPVAVLDTNTVLDWWVFGDAGVRPLADALAAGRILWRVSPAIVEELVAVLNRPMTDRWESRRQLALTNLKSAPWQMAAEPPCIRAHGLISRDPSDQKFVDLAIATGARWLFSRDKALLRLTRRAAPLGLTVTTPAAWAPPSGPRPIGR